MWKDKEKSTALNTLEEHNTCPQACACVSLGQRTGIHTLMSEALRKERKNYMQSHLHDGSEVGEVFKK